jgi:integrase
MRVLSRKELAALIRAVPADHRLMVRLMAATGLRWGEAAALRRLDLILDGACSGCPCDGQPHVHVRRAWSDKGQRMKPPKNDKPREVDLPASVADDLRDYLAATPGDPDGLLFPSKAGAPLRYSNMHRGRLKPAAKAAGVPWAGYHVLRHTYASLHLARGTNIVALSHLMGHHSPAFTLSRYAHLVPGERPAPLDLERELRSVESESNLSPDWTETDGNGRKAGNGRVVNLPANAALDGNERETAEIA